MTKRNGLAALALLLLAACKAGGVQPPRDVRSVCNEPHRDECRQIDTDGHASVRDAL